MSYKRIAGKYAGELADLHVEDGKCKIVVELPELLAQTISTSAIMNGGSQEIEIEFKGRKIKALAVEARIDTVDAGGGKLSGPNVVAFNRLRT